MNKKGHRLVGTLSTKESMQNLFNDLENANSMLSSQNTGVDITLSQPLTYSTPYIKKPLVEKKRKIEYSNDTHITLINSDKSLATVSKSQSPQVKRAINI